MNEPEASRAIASLLKPRSVALIGVSENPTSLSGAPLYNLRRYEYLGAIYPVNQRRVEVQGMRCFKSVLDIDATVDTAVITVPADSVIDVLGQCARKGIPSATVISAGFGEAAAGLAGQRRMAQLSDFLTSNPIRVLGPNTAGLVNLLDGYVPRSIHNQHDPEHVSAGNVALITQSGACGNIIFNCGQAAGVRIGLSVATGDQADVNVWDLCQYALAEPCIDVLMVVVETFGDVAKCESVAQAAARACKPIILLKLGQSEAGAYAVLSHSGSLAGNAKVQRAAMKQFGVTEVDNFDDLWQAAMLHQAWGKTGACPRSLGVFTISGGESALIADWCARESVTLGPISEAFKKVIEQNFGYAAPSNPFDATGEVVSNPAKLKAALGSFVGDNSFTEILMAWPVLRRELAERLGDGLRVGPELRGRNIVMSYWDAKELTEAQLAIISGTGLPVIPGSPGCCEGRCSISKLRSSKRDGCQGHS